MKFFLAGKTLETLEQELTAGLRKLSLTDNFHGFLWEGVIEAGEELLIPNKLVGQNGEKVLPRLFVIVDMIGPPMLTRGSVAWTRETLTLRNVGTTSTIGARVVFLALDQGPEVLNAEANANRILEIDYTTPPPNNGIPIYTQGEWIPAKFIDILSSVIPPGFIGGYGAENDPPGWLVCNGREVSRTQYSILFAVIGVTYGVGDGVDTFNIPDYRQRMMLGKADTGTGDEIGDTGGEIDHDHDIPKHFHEMGPGSSLEITASGGTTTGNNSVGHDHFMAGVNGSANTALTNGVPLSPDHDPGTNKAYNLVGTNHTATLGRTSTESATHTHDVPNHTHGVGDFVGAIGVVTGGVDGNDTMHSSTNNPPYQVSNFIIFTGEFVGGSGYLSGMLGLTYP